MLGARVLFQRAAVDVLHDDVAGLVVGDRVIDADDVGVRQFAGQRGLGQKQLAIAPAMLLVTERFREHHLHRNVAIDEGIKRFVNHAGCALAQFANDFVFADLF